MFTVILCQHSITNGVFRQSLKGTGEEWVTVFYAESSHCNLCRNWSITNTLALYQSWSRSRSRSHINSIWEIHKGVFTCIVTMSVRSLTLCQYQESVELWRCLWMWTDLKNISVDDITFVLAFAFLQCEWALTRCGISAMPEPCLITQNLLLRNVSYYWHEDPTERKKNFKAVKSSGL